MDYEFKKNGIISLKLKAENDAIEQAFFQALFNGEIEFEKTSSANHPDEIIIRKKVIPTIVKVEAPNSAL